MIQLQDMDNNSLLELDEKFSNFLTKNKHELKTIRRLNCVICLGTSTLILLSSLILGLIILGVYAAPIVDQIKSLNLSGLNAFSENIPEIITTIQKFKKVDVNEWNDKLNSIDSINRHLYAYDRNISVIMSYLLKFDNILHPFKENCSKTRRAI